MYLQASTLDCGINIPGCYFPNIVATPTMIFSAHLLGDTTTKGEQSPRLLELSSLPHYHLAAPIKISIHPDDDGWLAETEEMPLYAFGETYNQAISSIQQSIESLYLELSEDDNFSPIWLRIKARLRDIVRPL